MINYPAITITMALIYYVGSMYVLISVICFVFSSEYWWFDGSLLGIFIVERSGIDLFFHATVVRVMLPSRKRRNPGEPS